MNHEKASASATYAPCEKKERPSGENPFLNPKKVVLGLSGGVDSAVTALLLLEQGYEVHCLYLDNGVGDPTSARDTALSLHLPFHIKDIRAPLDAHVCRPFYDAYLHGKTPSPCALCNPTVKFPALLELADSLGAQWVATGHYARTAHAPGGKPQLLKAKSNNDQSYMLARLTLRQLERIIFPLGDYEKSQVRSLARAAGLDAAQKPDSMEICFIPDDNYPAWLDAYGPTPPEGNFVDPEGRILGRHKGIHHYTLGQGRGLGVSGPHKYYVSAIRPESNQVVLSDGGDLFVATVRCGEFNDLSPEGLTPSMSVTARFRHSKDEIPAVLHFQTDGTVLAETETPVRAPTPGQLAVFYQGDAVVASGWIL